ncbi:MAG: hypothetical protein LBL66_08525 [Clostridiales bacterium]|jgi:sialate O-acetylesterase|nr:hypothetical protein [Clostridiales bacterium]
MNKKRYFGFLFAAAFAALTAGVAAAAPRGRSVLAAVAPLYTERRDSGGANTPPEAIDMTYKGYKGYKIENTLYGTDADGDAVTYSVATQPAQGTVTVSGAKFTYTPAQPDFIGSTSFAYTADGGGAKTVALKILDTDKPYNPLADELAHPYTETLTVSGIFADGMVVQQGRPFKVWGLGKAGAAVTARFGLTAGGAQERADATVDEFGYWELSLPQKAASKEKHTLRVGDGATELAFNDVLIGEVWIAAGQSNMELNTQFILGAKGLLAAANNDNLRFFLTPQTAYGVSGAYDFYPNFFTPEGSRWGRGSVVADVRETYGVAYTFALKMYAALDVPIGILHAACGATGIEAWSSRAMVEDPVPLDDELERYGLTANNYDDGGANTVRSHLAYFSSYRTDGGAGKTAWNGAGGENYNQSTAMFNTKVAPIAAFGYKGILWMQGENNLGGASRAFYARLLRNLPAGWAAFGDGEAKPLVFSNPAAHNIEWIPNVYYPVECLPEWIEMQSDVFEGGENPAGGDAFVQIPIYDVSPQWKEAGNTFAYINPVHPLDKRPVGERMAASVLGEYYGLGSDYLAPVYRSKTVSGNVMTLAFGFADAGLGLRTGTRVKGFTVAGADGQHYAADAEIEGNTARLSSPSVAAPVYASYAFTTMSSSANVVNASGIPLVPFRTDRTAAQNWLLPHEWLYCDALQTWESKGSSAEYVNLYLKTGGSFTLAADPAVRFGDGDGSLKLAYTSTRVSFAPKLDLANIAHQLDMFSSVSVRVYNPDNREKTVGIKLTSNTLTYDLKLRSEDNKILPGWTVVAFDLDRATLAGSPVNLNADVLGKTAELRIEFNDTRAGTLYVGGFELGARGADKTPQARPAAPAFTDIQAASAAVVPVAGAEYSLDRLNWQDGNVFTGLTPSAYYTVYIRLKETASAAASPSASAVITLAAKNTPAAPPTPTADVTHDTVTVRAEAGAVYSLDGAAWQPENTFTGLSPETEYTVYVKLAGTETEYESAPSSAKFTTAAAPKEPDGGEEGGGAAGKTGCGSVAAPGGGGFAAGGLVLAAFAASLFGRKKKAAACG